MQPNPSFCTPFRRAEEPAGRSGSKKISVFAGHHCPSLNAMHRYSDLRRRAVECVSKFSAAGSVLVLAPVRAAAEEVALAACGSALLGVRRFAFREFVLD